MMKTHQQFTKALRRLLWCSLIAVILTGGLLVSGNARAVESVGAPDTNIFTTTTTEFPNPERGWYLTASAVSPWWYFSDVTSGMLSSVYSGGKRLAISILYLGDYRTTATLPGSYLTTMTAKFALFRAAGMKVVLRPAYNYDSGGADATLAIAQGHLAQLAPILKANADVIHVLQAGMIGAWGEWHTSQTLCPGLQPACRLAVIQALLNATDPRTQIAVRYPRHLSAWYPQALGKAERFSGSQRSRIGHHNDCFMSSPNDVGTYTSNTLGLANTERARVAADTQYTPFGGETCSGFGPTRQTCTDILAEAPAYHLNYANRNFYTAFYNQWISEGCYDEVTRKMGYRFQLDSATMQTTADVGESVTMTVDMRNQGYSRIFSARRLNLQLRHQSTGQTLICVSDQDLRELPPNSSSSSTIRIRCPLSSLPTGVYDTYLAIPDIWSGTAANPSYSVRPANLDNGGAGQSWDSTNGRFKTGHTLTIS